MMVVKVADMLQMEQIEPHEVLQRKGLLQEWKPGMGQVSFVSQTWLSTAHPDRDGLKLRLLQSFLSRSLEGRMQIDLHYLQALTVGSQRMTSKFLKESLQKSFVWLDYWSIPQYDRNLQLNAINSIPSYIGDCAFFICLVPAVLHEDGSLRDRRGWKRRGWCRLENTSNALSPTPKPCIVVESMSSIFLDPESDWLEAPVGMGDFTVDSDKEVVKPMIQRMVAARQQQAALEEDLDFFRMLEAMKGVLLQGFTVACDRAPAEKLEDWMARMMFSQEDVTRTKHGWTPLRFAAYLGRQDFALELVRLGADIHAPLSEARLDCGWQSRGSTILQGLCALKDDPAMLELLMEHGADPCSKQAGNGFTALHFACAAGHCGNIRAIMARAPEAADIREGLGAQPWVCSCARGKAEALELFLDEYPEKVGSDPQLTVNGWGHGFCGNAVIDAGDLKTLQILLDRQYDINFVGKATQTKARSVIMLAQTVCRLQRNPGTLMEYVANGPSMPPLCHAAYHGNLGAVELLLSRGADVHQTNAYGRTALIFAAMRGHEGVADLLLRAGAATETADCWGLSAAAWADRRGYTRLAETLHEEGMPVVRRVRTDPSSNRGARAAASAARVRRRMRTLFLRAPSGAEPASAEGGKPQSQDRSAKRQASLLGHGRS